MTVIVIGLGSMGKRRIRLIKKYDQDIMVIGVDNNLQRREESFNEYKIKTFSSIEEAIDFSSIKCAFICTSPLSHSSIITRCLELGIHVFTELNLVEDGYNYNIELANINNLVLFMSSTFLYRNEINKIKTLVNASEFHLNYTYHVGQYLPDWHPWENYEDFFVGNKKTNGCREIFAIELPWMIDVFGDVDQIKVVKNKISDLNIDYNDNYLVIIEHTSGHKGVLAVDIVSRKAVRNLEIFGQDLYVSWDGSPDGLLNYDYMNKTNEKIKLYEEIDQLQNYSGFVVENAYMGEIVAFFDTVLNGTVPIYSFEEDKKILKIIDKIEE